MDEWKQKIRERYRILKDQGKPFFPHSVAKDAVTAALVFSALLFLALKFGADLEDPADATDISYNPRPEWYFLFFFQFLKFFPGRLEPVAAILLPGIGALLLFLLPILDRNKRRHPSERHEAVALGIIAIFSVVFLTVEGARSPLVAPIVEKDPRVLSGKKLFVELRCMHCHSVNGRGGMVGPNLSNIIEERDDSWLEKHFKNPKEVTPGSVMPSFDLIENETRDLIAYLRNLRGGGPYSPRAKILFKENCVMCHRVGNIGMEAPIDLSGVGSYRDKPYIYQYIENPKSINRESTMPDFKEILTAEEIEDLSRFLAAQKKVE